MEKIKYPDYKPFPSSSRIKGGSESVSRSFVSDLLRPHGLACQAKLSMGFHRQENCSGLPFPSPEDLPDPGIEPMSPTSPALVGGFFTTELPGKPRIKGRIGLFIR